MRSLTNSSLWAVVFVLFACLCVVVARRTVQLIDRIESVCEATEGLIQFSTTEMKRHSNGVADSKQKIDSILDNADELLKSWKRRRLFPLEEESPENVDHDSL